MLYGFRFARSSRHGRKRDRKLPELDLHFCFASVSAIYMKFSCSLHTGKRFVVRVNQSDWRNWRGRSPVHVNYTWHGAAWHFQGGTMRGWGGGGGEFHCARSQNVKILALPLLEISCLWTNSPVWERSPLPVLWQKNWKATDHEIEFFLWYCMFAISTIRSDRLLALYLDEPLKDQEYRVHCFVFIFMCFYFIYLFILIIWTWNAN